MPAYQGHPSWNAWNVSLWLHNDEGLYRDMLAYLRQHSTKAKAARAMARDYDGQRTPDGGRFNYRTIYLAMKDED